MSHPITESARFHLIEGGRHGLMLDHTFYVVRHLIDAKFPETYSISAFGNTHYQSSDPAYLVDILVFAIETMAQKGHVELKNGEWISCSN